MSDGGADARILENDDRSYVKFNRLLERAQAEGRVDGKHRCPTCGMRFNNDANAANCCAVVARSA
jgi:hypothetical protein